MRNFLKIAGKVVRVGAFAGLSVQIFLSFVLIISDLPTGFMMATIFVVIDLFLWVNFGKPTIYKNIVIGSLFVIIFLTGSMYAILFQIKNFIIVPNSYHIGSINDWMAYSGSIIGGSMTMFALLFTIQYEDKKRNILQRQNELMLKEEKASIYLPIIEFRKTDLSIGELNLSLYFTTEKPIRYFRLSEQKFGESTRLNNIFKHDEIPFLFDKNHINITLTVDTDKIPEDLGKEEYLVTLKFDYNDVLNLKRYSHKIEFPLKIEPYKTGRKCYIEIDNEIKNYPVNSSYFFDETEYLNKGN